MEKRHLLAVLNSEPNPLVDEVIAPSLMGLKRAHGRGK